MNLYTAINLESASALWHFYLFPYKRLCTVAFGISYQEYTLLLITNAVPLNPEEHKKVNDIAFICRQRKEQISHRDVEVHSYSLCRKSWNKNSFSTLKYSK